MAVGEACGPASSEHGGDERHADLVVDLSRGRREEGGKEEGDGEGGVKQGRDGRERGVEAGVREGGRDKGERGCGAL